MRPIDADALEEILTTAIRNMRGMAKFIGAEDDPEIKMEIKAYTDILDGVKKLPTVDADTGWIPVEDRPPENADTKLLTHEIHFTNGVIKRDVAAAYYDDENEDWLTESENPEILCYPLAWRDLPKPYEPKEDN